MQIDTPLELEQRVQPEGSSLLVISKTNIPNTTNIKDKTHEKAGLLIIHQLSTFNYLFFSSFFLIRFFKYFFIQSNLLFFVSELFFLDLFFSPS